MQNFAFVVTSYSLSFLIVATLPQLDEGDESSVFIPAPLSLKFSSHKLITHQ